MAETIAGTHCAYLRRDGQAEWTLVAGINPPQVVANPMYEPIAWNSLPLQIRSASTISTFKNILKTRLSH